MTDYVARYCKDDVTMSSAMETRLMEAKGSCSISVLWCDPEEHDFRMLMDVRAACPSLHKTRGPPAKFFGRACLFYPCPILTD